VTVLTRSLTALVVVSTLTAFAPAPFPKTRRDRGSEGITAQDLQGVWKAIGIEEKQTDGRMKKIPWGYTQIIIRGDHWSFRSDGKEGHALWMTLLDDARVDLRTSNRREDSVVGLAGILKRRGNTLLLLYTFPPAKRPTNFDQIPAGCRLMTLEKDP
jgi:hypothetical protein